MKAWEAIKKFLKKPVLILILRVALGVVFIAASLDKIAHPEEFAQNIANYRMLPYQLINFSAIFLPWLEIVTGILLVVGVWIRANVVIINGMLVMFIIAISQAIYRDLDISCGCFTTDPAAQKMSKMTLYWDIIWLGWGALVLLYDDALYSVIALVNKVKGETKNENA